MAGVFSKGLVGAVVEAVLTGGLACAAAGATSVADVTGVGVAWSGESVALSWSDPAGGPHGVYAETGGERWSGVLTQPADGATSILLPATGLPNDDGVVRLCVVAGTVQTPTSEPACSPEFDTLLASPATVTGVAPTYGGDARIAWSAGPPPSDPNPGDPLDRAAAATHNLVRYTELPHEYFWLYPVATAVPSPATATVGGRVGGFAVLPANEWGQRWYVSYVTDEDERWPPSWVRLQDPQVRATLPTSGTFGVPIPLVVRFVREQGPILLPWDDSPGDNLVCLQESAPGANAWRNAACVAPAADAPAHSEVRLSLRPGGAADWRVATRAWSAPRADGGWSAVLGTLGPATRMSATAWVRSARFLDPTVSGTQKAVAHLWLQPGLSGKVRLQRLVGSSWANVVDVPIANGVVDYRMTGPRGTSTWRFVIAGRAAPDGRLIATTTSPAFRLTRS